MVIAIVIASFPIATQAYELPQYESVIVYTEEDGITTVVDIDELLEELSAQARGNPSCDELDLFISMLIEHQLTSEPLYMTTWVIYSDNARNLFPMPYLFIHLLAIADGVIWTFTNTHTWPVVVNATGRLYRNFHTLERQGTHNGTLGAGLSNRIMLQGSIMWDRTTLSIVANGQQRFFYIGRL